MSWSALGRDPAPGDVGEVDRLASSFGVIADRSEDLLGVVRRIDGGAGTGVWRGPAADDFRLLLGEIGPGLMTLSNAYRDAQRAASTYSGALADAQDLARRAETDAEHALTDRADAEKRRRSAATDAGSHAADGRAAWLRVAEAQALQLTTAVIADPGYAATVANYERQMRGRYSQAQTAESEARGRERAAQDDVRAADHSVDRARRLGDDASDDHDRAKRAFVRALRDAGDASGVHPDLLDRVWREMSRSVSVQLDATREFGEKSWNQIERGPHYDKNKKKKDEDETPEISVMGTVSTSGSAALHDWGSEGGRGPTSWSADAQALGAEGSAEAGIGRLDDGSYGTAVGASGSVFVARGEAKGRLGNDRLAVEGKVDGQVGARGEAGVDIGFGKDKAKATIGVDGFAGGEIGGEAGLDVGGVKPTVNGHLQYGAGFTAKTDIGYSNGKFKIKGDYGLALGLGAKVGGGVEIDVPKLADNLGDAGKGAFGFAKKSIGSIPTPW